MPSLARIIMLTSWVASSISAYYYVYAGNGLKCDSVSSKLLTLIKRFDKAFKRFNETFKSIDNISR